MNDFTKEELLHIFDSVNTDAKYYGDEHIAHPILKKIQSMIDNYCEHNDVWHKTDADYVPICSKCDKLIGYL